MYVEVIDTINRLEAVSEEWNAVLASSRADTIFLTSDWLISWWKGYQPAGRLLCLSVRDKKGRAVGFAPLFLKNRKKRGIKYRALIFLGDGTNDSEYLDIFCAEGYEHIVLPLLLDWIANNRGLWDVCEWNVIPKDSYSLHFIKEWILSQKGYHFTKPYECSHVQLPDSYDKYLQLLSKKHRQNVRYYRKRAESRSQAQYLRLEDPDILDEALKQLYLLHTRRWNHAGGQGSFTDQGRVRFYGIMARRMNTRGWLHFRQLNLVGRPAALQIGFIYNDTYTALQEGFDPEMGRECPGVVLRAMVIQELINKGTVNYDFLGLQTRAKERWNAQVHHCSMLTVAPKNIRTHAVVGVPHGLEKIKAGLKKHTPHHVLALKRRVQNMLRRENSLDSKSGNKQ